MELVFDHFAKQLTKYNPALAIINDGKRVIKGIKLLDKSQSVLKPELLYLGRISNIDEQRYYDSEVNIVCIADKYISKKKFIRSNKINIIVIDKNMDVSYICNELQEVFRIRQSSTAMAIKLMNLLVMGSGLQDIADASLEIIGNPIVIINLADNSVFCSKVQIDHPVWTELVNSKYITLDLAIKYKAFGIVEELNKEQKELSPFLIKGSINRPNRIAVNVFIHQKLAAYVIIPDLLRKFSERDITVNLELAELLADVVALEIQKSQPIQYNRGHVHEYLIKDLLDGVIFEESELAKRLHNAGIKLRKAIYVLVIDLSRNEFSGNELHLAIERLNSLFKSVVCQVYKDTVLLLTTRNHNNYISSDDEKEINNFLIKNNLTGGLSHRFSDFGDLKKYYEQAKIAIDLGIEINKVPALYCYKYYIMDHIARICSRKIDITSLCHPLVFTLHDYDERNNTCYLDTLYAYIRNDKCALTAAEALHIHRNTLNYRLNKIAEMINIDWNDGELLAHVYLSLKMLDFMKLKKSQAKEDLRDISPGIIEVVE